jgi:hypothetical protein
MSQKESIRRSGFSTLGLMLVVLCLSVAAICWAVADSPDEKVPSASGVFSDRAESRTIADTKTSPDGNLLPIEQIRVGQRVVTPETTPDASFPTAVDPATWKRVSLKMVTTYSGGLVDTMQVQTLQGPTWLAEHSVQVGARVPIPLDLKEMGVEEQLAEVTAVSACPPIETGPGRVVLTTLNHLNTFLYHLTTTGINGTCDTLGVTGYHRFFTEDRGWVIASELKRGERLRTPVGNALVSAIDREPGTFTVYNLTVENEHTYFVGSLSLLVHNTCREVNLTTNKGMTVGSPMTDQEAIEHVQNGGDVMAGSQSEARSVARAAGGGNEPILDSSPHANVPPYAQRPHYHPSPRTGGHVFY